jgi:isoleucyl-tRNA synthetase
MPYSAEQFEKEILEFWDKNKIFEKSVNERPENKPYVFYDGPPFATGLPHYGHIVASLMKDIVPRFWTMKGKKVERIWGWDCHGLPIENIIEKELNLNSKKDIDNFGIANFNEACRATVLKYSEEWKKTIRRMGRWVDMENDYKTMDMPFMESVWWVFKQLWDNNLIYKGHKAMHICPRCVTPLSNFEVTHGYKDIKDISITVKFKVKNPGKAGLPDNTFILAWTTTPWTLPGNVLLAVNKEIEYSLVEIEGEDNKYIAGKDRVEYIFKDKKYKVDASKRIFGKDLIGLSYEPLFPYFANTENAFRVVEGDFVTTADGTGVVHIAPAFGEDDYNVGKREKVPLVQHVTMEGKFIDAVKDFAGMEVKPKEDPTKTDVEVLKWLAVNNKLFSKEKFEHSYPHCWRCDTPLLNYATTSWFVKVIEIKDQLLKNNHDITWVPEHIKEGRFGQWLEGARDWAVSRNRYWGTPLPVWESEDEDVICVGSAKELEELTGEKITDLHKHKIDNLEIKKNNKIYKRIPEVLDCWFESGSMPYGQMHYPFENKKKFESGFPAEFIAEGQDQTRGWFYTLHVLATALTMGKKPSIPSKKSVPAFKNCIVNGIVLAEDGKKMSKRLKNYPEPEIILEKYGADAMRYYLAVSPVMEAESLNFSEAGVREMYNKVVNILWNSVVFYEMYSSKDEKMDLKKLTVLDKWILSKLQLLIQEVTSGMENYKLAQASRPILDFITELSQWYVRRSRERFKSENHSDASTASAVLREVLLTLSKIMAPVTPFIVEKIYIGITNSKEQQSVHLEKWPVINKKLLDEKIIEKMSAARKIVELGLSLRAEHGIKVRQPLASLEYGGTDLSKEFLNIIAEEVNVLDVLPFSDKTPVNFAEKESNNIKARLNLEISEELKWQGISRELVRAINQIRKEKGFTMSDICSTSYYSDDEEIVSVFSKYSSEICKKTRTDKLVLEKSPDFGSEIEIDERKIRLDIVN